MQTYNFKYAQKPNIDYDTFRKSLLTADADKQVNKLRNKDLEDNKFLSWIKNVHHLNTIINPSNKDLDRDEQKELEHALVLRDKDEELNDDFLEKRLLSSSADNTIESFNKYLNIMLNRHLKFNEIEEAEIKKRKIEDLDLNNITEHFISKKAIIDKAYVGFIQYKATVNQQEAQFIKRIFDDLKSTLEFYIDLSWKLRKNREDVLLKNQHLIDQNNEFLNALTAIKQMKNTENSDYYLFGIKR